MADYKYSKKEDNNFISCEYFSTMDGKKVDAASIDKIYFCPFFIRAAVTVDALTSSEVFGSGTGYAVDNLFGLYESDKKTTFPNNLIEYGKVSKELSNGIYEFENSVTLSPGIYWGAEGISTTNKGFNQNPATTYPSFFTFSMEASLDRFSAYCIEYNVSGEEKMPEKITKDMIEEDNKGYPLLNLRVVG